MSSFVFFFNDTATTEIYTLSLHDALPIYIRPKQLRNREVWWEGSHRSKLMSRRTERPYQVDGTDELRSEEHTSELQSRPHLVCRLLLEKKKHSVYDRRRVR